jgi:hypothetical protein
MPILTATDCTVFSNISASAATITTSGLIPIVQARITWMTNNYFVSDLHVRDSLTFNATARTVTASITWSDYNFLAGDDVYIYHSYRNDGYQTISSVSTSVMTLITGATVIDELSGRSILVSVVDWPNELKQVAALMVAYDYDSRPKRTPGVTSRGLGPWRESYSASTDVSGYPPELVDMLTPFRMVRLL